MKRKFTSLKRLSSLFSSTEQKHGPSQHVNRSALTEHTQTCLDASKTSIGRSMPPSNTYMEISRLCHKRSSSGGYRSPDTATEPQRKWYIMYYCGGLVAMSVTEASHTQIPSRGMRAWKKKTSLWQWRTARCGGRLWIRSRLPGPPDDEKRSYRRNCSPGSIHSVNVTLNVIKSQS